MSIYIGRRDGPPVKLPKHPEPDMSFRGWLRVLLLLAALAIVYLVALDDSYDDRWLPKNTAAKVTGYQEWWVDSRRGNVYKECVVQLNGDTVLYNLRPQDSLFGMGDSIFRESDSPNVTFIDSADPLRTRRPLDTYPTK